MKEVTHSADVMGEKYTFVFNDGYLSTEHSLPEGIQIRHLQDTEGTLGIVIQVAKNCCIPCPLHLVFTSSRPTHIRNHIEVEEGAEVVLIEEYISTDAENVATATHTELHLGSRARIKFHKIQDEHLTASHISNIHIYQQQDSRADVFTLSKGAQSSRENLQVKLTAQGAECHLSGWYALHHDGQELAHYLQVDHVAKHGVSSMLYKGILDKKSKASFSGKVHVHPQAQHINASQANHNLLLSKEAEVSSKPDLEIYADDVKCTHGATMGQLDAEALFYFRSRGVDKETATRFLLDAFAEEVMNRIEHAAVRQYLQTRVGRYAEH